LGDGGDIISPISINQHAPWRCPFPFALQGTGQQQVLCLCQIHIMGTIFADSPFYLRPEEVVDTHPTGNEFPSSGQSRAIDFKFRQMGNRYIITHNPNKVSNAKQLLEWMDERLMPDDGPKHPQEKDFLPLDRL
jgi:hypothetical protein